MQQLFTEQEPDLPAFPSLPHSHEEEDSEIDAPEPPVEIEEAESTNEYSYQTDESDYESIDERDEQYNTSLNNEGQLEVNMFEETSSKVLDLPEQ